ncbi:MAG: hypothetical protein AAGI07_12495 [Bacteroidota bacterium]
MTKLVEESNHTNLAYKMESANLAFVQPPKISENKWILWASWCFITLPPIGLLAFSIYKLFA